MSWRTSAAGGVAIAVAAAAVVLAAGQDPQPVHPSGQPQERPVTSTTLSCPASPTKQGPDTTVFAVGPDATTVGSGRLTLTGSAAPDGRALAETSTPLQPVLAHPTATTGQPSVLMTAQGSLAPGATAAQLSAASSKSTSGLATSWCAAPRGDWWFNGVDTSVGTTTDLVLSNPGSDVAVVDLQILGPRGVIDAAGAQSIALAAHSREALDMARFAPGQRALTLHLTATSGAVAAAVSTTRLDGLVATGSDWVDASADPARDVVVGAGVEAATHQRLVIANPGSRQQLVSVTILDKDGAFTSTKLTDVQVPPGSVVVKDLTTITQKRATAVELHSAAPVTGAIVSETSGRTRDVAVSTAAEPMGSPAVVPTMAGTRLTLAVASPSPGPQDVRIRGFDHTGAQISSTGVTVAGRATTTWELPADSRASYLVVTVPSGGRLSATATYSAAAGTSQLPVLSGSYTVVRPVVLP